MATILIAYNLNDPDQDYEALRDVIKGLGSAWWHHLDSLWIVKTTMTPRGVRDALAKVLDTTDKILVIDVTKRSRAWRGLSDRGSLWLKQTYD
jgi:hypothetical protein